MGRIQVHDLKIIEHLGLSCPWTHWWPSTPKGRQSTPAAGKVDLGDLGSTRIYVKGFEPRGFLCPGECAVYCCIVGNSGPPLLTSKARSDRSIPLKRPWKLPKSSEDVLGAS